MKSYSHFLFALLLAVSSCRANQSGGGADAPSILQEGGIDSPQMRAVAPVTKEAADDFDEGEDIPLTKARIDAEIKSAGLPVLFDKEADLNKDGIPDRLVILEDAVKATQSGAREVTGRRLMLYRGESGGQYAVWAVTSKAIPPYNSQHMVGAETSIENISIGSGTFSFAWVNESYFTYRYQFVYDGALQTLKLSQMVVEEERAERYPQEEIADLRLTEKNFGQQPIEFFDANKLQGFTDPEVRKRLKL